MEIRYLKRAIALAAQAREKGNHPFGALLVKDDQIILESENAVITDSDVTRHAELSLISQASQKFSQSVLSESTLYTSCEPCAMCAGAIYWSGVRRIVYGLKTEKLAQLAGEHFEVDCRDLLEKAVEKVEVSGPHLDEESAYVHLDFWDITKKG